MDNLKDVKCTCGQIVKTVTKNEITYSKDEKFTRNLFKNIRKIE